MSSEVHFENGPVDTSSLKGKSVIITGGSSGMGRMQSVNWASAGAYVTVADVQDKMGNELVKEITASGGKATYVHCDVTNYESSAAAFKHAIEFSPSKTLDIAVLYAGVIGDARNLVEIVEANGPPSIDKVPTPPSQAAMTINLLGLHYSAYLALHYMRLPPSSQSNGATTNVSTTSDKSLIFIDSLAGYTDYPNNSAYGAGKFGVRGLFRSVRHHSPRIGVRLNLVAPWFIYTPMTQAMKDGLDAAGVKDGQGFTWAKGETVIEAVSHCATTKVDGRAIAVVPEGFTDLNDDLEKGHGGDIILDLISRRLAAGDRLA